MNNIGNGNIKIRDESSYDGCAAEIYRPKNREELTDVVLDCVSRGAKITVSGALTGLSGSGVPNNSVLISMERFNSIEYNADNTVTCGAGTSFDDIEKAVTRQSGRTRFFPASPTEKTATIGGALSLGTAGVFGFGYGSVAEYVEELEYINSDGKTMKLSKTDEDLSLFLDTEGMCGIITEVRLRTVANPEARWAIWFFFKDDEAACKFADTAAENANVCALEYMDRKSLMLVEAQKGEITAAKNLPMLPEDMNACIYTELLGVSDAVEEAAEALLEYYAELGEDPDAAMALEGDAAEKLNSVRHAITECANLQIARAHAQCSAITKLCLDIRYDKKSRIDIIRNYRNAIDSEGLEYCIYGHLGTKSPYLEILPRTTHEYKKGTNILKKLYIQAADGRDEIFAEQGVGKIKGELFADVTSDVDINNRSEICEYFDKNHLFNPGNAFLIN